MQPRKWVGPFSFCQLFNFSANEKLGTVDEKLGKYRNWPWLLARLHPMHPAKVNERSSPKLSCFTQLKLSYIFNLFIL